MQPKSHQKQYLTIQSHNQQAAKPYNQVSGSLNFSIPSHVIQPNSMYVSFDLVNTVAASGILKILSQQGPFSQAKLFINGHVIVNQDNLLYCQRACSFLKDFDSSNKYNQIFNETAQALTSTQGIHPSNLINGKVLSSSQYSVLLDSQQVGQIINIGSLENGQKIQCKIFLKDLVPNSFFSLNEYISMMNSTLQLQWAGLTDIFQFIPGANNAVLTIENVQLSMISSTDPDIEQNIQVLTPYSENFLYSQDSNTVVLNRSKQLVSKIIFGFFQNSAFDYQGLVSQNILDLNGDVQSETSVSNLKDIYLKLNTNLLNNLDCFSNDFQTFILDNHEQNMRDIPSFLRSHNSFQINFEDEHGLPCSLDKLTSDPYIRARYLGGNSQLFIQVVYKSILDINSDTGLYQYI